LLSLLVKSNAKHVVYDAVSESEADAFETVYGEEL
jgi:hypothetical protein